VKNLKKIRESKGISKTKLAKHVGLKYHTILRYEQGKIRNPSYWNMSKIAAALGVSVDEIMGDHIGIPSPKSEDNSS